MGTKTRTPLKLKLYRSDLPILEEGAANTVQAATEVGGGVLRCFPSFVGRKFCLPGKNLELVRDVLQVTGYRTLEAETCAGRCRARDRPSP